MSKAQTGAIATGSRSLTRLRDIVFDNMIWILLLIGIVVFAFRIPKFFSVPNFLNVLLHVSPLGMLVLAALIFVRHWTAPWLTATLGVGLIIWILVQLAIMPETMILQPIFLGTGLLMGVVALFWLRRTGQLRLW